MAPRALENKHIDALMQEWANEEISDADLLELLISALAELNSYQREQE